MEPTTEPIGTADSISPPPGNRLPGVPRTRVRPPAPTPAALDEYDTSKYIGFSRPFLRRTRRTGGGPPFILVGRTVRYIVSDLDHWLASRRRLKA
jgi:hypothetical protein